jgi:hypothetical protein
MTRPDSDEPRPEILESQPGWWTALTLPKPPRWLLLVAAALLLAGGGAVLAVSHSSPGKTGRPGQPGTGPIPLTTLIPTACGHFTSGRTSASLPSGYRVILRDIAVPPAYVGPMLPNGNGPWRYWRMAVFRVRGGSPPVTLSVPTDQQHEAAIDLEAGGIGSIFHLPGCPPSYVWRAAVGGFYLKAPSACLPVRVQVGQQAATVRFGLGRPCPVSAPSALLPPSAVRTVIGTTGAAQ